LVKSKDPDLGYGILDEPPRSYFIELRNHFLGLKFFDAYHVNNSDPGTGREKSRIRDQRSGINIQDLQHCNKAYPVFNLTMARCLFKTPKPILIKTGN
jgi:hypothetical protein